MSFISFAFVALYLIALIVRWLPIGHRGATGIALPRIAMLLLLSWTFYAWHQPWYILLILFSTAVDYVAGLLLAETMPGNYRTRRALLASSVVMNLSLLMYFKYAGFLVEEVNALGDTDWSLATIVLPVGISFYTFQSMSYTIDVYRGVVKPERSVIRFACYIAFFPQLVAGPIVRASEFLYQFSRRRKFHGRIFIHGGYLILRGLFLKMVLADNLGRIVDQYWTQAADEAGGTLALTLLFFFACQLLCDFAGYVDIARGAAYQLGFRLPINFNAPYIATTFAEFWRRWHISLSQWLRDYLYAPLGGNRRGRVRTGINVLLVMLLSGLWHGAAWTYVAWGGVLGLALVLERCCKIGVYPRNALSVLVWFFIVQLTWVLSLGFFRATDIDQALAISWSALRGLIDLLFGDYALPAESSLLFFGACLTLPVAFMHVRTWLAENTALGTSGRLERSVYGGLMLAAILSLHSTSYRFIYFQF